MNLCPDFPPYQIIVASEELEFSRPADHLWIRVDGSQIYHVCPLCIKESFKLMVCEFTDSSSTRRYRIGQCPDCCIVYFTELKVTPHD